MEGGEQDGSSKPPSACSPRPEQTVLSPPSGGPGVPGEPAVQDEGCSRDAQTEVSEEKAQLLQVLLN